jgi:hypothetical protein
VTPDRHAPRARPRALAWCLFATAGAAGLLLGASKVSDAAPAGGGAKKPPNAAAPRSAAPAKPKVTSKTAVRTPSGGAARPRPTRATTASAAEATPRGTPTPAPPREVSVTGELVETGCFFVGGRRGPHHRACAMGCARVGQPVAIVDDSGVLRIAVLDHRNETPENPLIEHLGRRVELSGTAVERGGVHGILVRNVRPLSPPRPRD